MDVALSLETTESEEIEHVGCQTGAHYQDSGKANNVGRLREWKLTPQ